MATSPYSDRDRGGEHEQGGEGDRRDARDPSPEEFAAIVAAIEIAWPRRAVDATALAPSPWRFSNRWWMPRRSAAADRARP
jgi:hypothetical protein